jgi:hypothetical protein
MSTQTPLTASQKKVFTAFLAVLLPISYFLIFILPWHMPLRGPIQSESYTFGFSNITAHLGLALSIAVIFGIRLLIPSLGDRDRKLGEGLFCAPVQRSHAMNITVLGCISLTLVVVGGWWHLLPFGYFGESTFFLTRLDMMTLGKVPYQDFDFGYGPAMLWLPFLIHKAAHGLVAMDTAYIATVLLHYTLGILALEYIVRSLKISDRCRIGLLIFATLASLNITLGVIYTPLRFIYALWAIFFLHQTFRTSSLWKCWMVAFLLPFLGLLLSPESGLVTCLALLIGLLWYFKIGEGIKALAALAVAAALAAAVGLLGLGYFKMILFFGGGAYNFPILPSPYIISLLLVVCWLIPQLADAGWRLESTAAPLLISLVIALGLFLPAALGRCDPGHVLLNGLGVLILGIAAAFYGKSLRLKVATVAAAAILFITTQISFWSHYDTLIANALSTRHVIEANRSDIEVGEWQVQSRLSQDNIKMEFDWDKRLPFTPDFLELLHYPSLATPLGVGEDADRFLKVSGRYVPQYYVPPFISTFTPVSVARLLDELKKQEFILIPQHDFSHLQPMNTVAYGQSWSRFLSGLFVFPVNLPVVHEPYIPEAVIMRSIINEFEVENKLRDYLILRRKGTKSGA